MRVSTCAACIAQMITGVNPWGIIVCVYVTGFAPVYLFEVLLALLFGFQPRVLNICLFGLHSRAYSAHCNLGNKNPYCAFLHLSPESLHTSVTCAELQSRQMVASYINNINKSYKIYLDFF